MLPPPVDIPKYATMATVTTPEVKSAAQQHKKELVAAGLLRCPAGLQAALLNNSGTPTAVVAAPQAWLCSTATG